jgi:alpha-tubulin suppressor-like RCC1 family protein
VRGHPCNGAGSRAGGGRAGHALAITSGGIVWAWGSNANGQLGDGTLTGHDTPEQVTGAGTITARRATGRRANQLTPVQVAGLTGVTQVAGGGSGYSLAVYSQPQGTA